MYENGPAPLGVKRAVVAAMNRLGLRYRFRLENIDGTDSWWIIREPRLRRLPAVVRRQQIELAERAKHCHDLEEARDIIAERDRLDEDIRTGRIPYPGAGRQPAKATKNRWESLPVGEIELRDDVPARLHASFASWAKTRHLTDARISCVRLGNGKTAVQRIN